MKVINLKNDFRSFSEIDHGKKILEDNQNFY